MDSKPIYHIPFRGEKGCVLFEVLAACISRPLQPTKAPKAPAYVYVTPCSPKSGCKAKPKLCLEEPHCTNGF